MRESWFSYDTRRILCLLNTANTPTSSMEEESSSRKFVMRCNVAYTRMRDCHCCCCRDRQTRKRTPTSRFVSFPPRAGCWVDSQTKCFFPFCLLRWENILEREKRKHAEFDSRLVWDYLISIQFQIQLLEDFSFRLSSYSLPGFCRGVRSVVFESATTCTTHPHK